MNQQPAPLISTLLTTRTFLLEYVIGGWLTKWQIRGYLCFIIMVCQLSDLPTLGG